MMARFIYQAINEIGNSVSGVMEADSEEEVTDLLTERGLIPSQILQEGVRGISWTDFWKSMNPIRSSELILFTKQFRTMVRAGMPILNLLQVLETQTENERLRGVAGSILASVRDGLTLHDAFSRHPKVFSPLYCSMVRVGESSGVISEVMDRLIYIIEHEEKIRSDIKAALTYPIMVIVFLGIAFFVLLTFAIPKFSAIFMRSGIALPLPTRICVSLYQFLINYWYGIAGIVIIGVPLTILYLRTDQGRYLKDALILKLPIFGPVFLKAVMSRFASIFAILYESGIQVVDCMKILSETIGNRVIKEDFNLIIDRVEEGRGISDPLKYGGHFTPMVIHMVALGEGAGKLDEMLREISKHYDDEVEYAIKRMSDAIVPLLTIGLAVIVGFFALAIFLPMWDLSKVVLKG
jgi:type II secretory pathway component PulF